MNKTTSLQRGFTLIEVIVTLVIFGILGAALFAYFGNTALLESTNPLIRLDTSVALQRDLEQIINDFKNENSLSAEPGHTLDTTPPLYYELSGGAIVPCSGSTQPTDCTGGGSIMRRITLKNNDSAFQGEELTVFLLVPES